MSLPTAVTANIGIPYFSPSLTNLARFDKVLCSYLPPTNTDIARHETLSLIASSIDVVIVSFERSSPKMLAPPETRRTIGTVVFGSTDVLNTPRVNIKESAKGKIGLMVSLGISSLSVGPRKYPWSTASITHRPSLIPIILDILFCIPQSIFYHLFHYCL